MMHYIGTKEVYAKPMTRQAYNDLRGWTVPSDENPNDEGYLVEYVDGGNPNHPDFKGYISWSPKDVFERTYHEVTESSSPMTETNDLPFDPNAGFDFGQALALVKEGELIAREGWNGKGMFILLMTGEDVTAALSSDIPILDAIYMKTADDKLVPWVASQTDILADDWVLVTG